MSFTPSKSLKTSVAELLTHYPKDQQRSASLMVLHAIQEEQGYVKRDAMEWAAGELGLKPMNLYELVTFYPMLREEPAGKNVLKICRTLSCAMAGGRELHQHICNKLRLDSQKHGLQTSANGQFSVEFSECLASCGTGPVMMCNDDFYEAVSHEQADEIMEGSE